MHALPKEIGASNRHFGRIWPEFADAWGSADRRSLVSPYRVAPCRHRGRRSRCWGL